jgi:predicted metalloprotease with PDZ domain
MTMKNTWQIKRWWHLMGAACAIGSLLLAQPSAAQDAEEEVRRAEREAKRAEVAAARAELAAKAKELAMLERELVDEEVERKMVIRSLDGLDTQVQVIVERVVDGLNGDGRPKLGVLLGGNSGDFKVIGVSPDGGAEAAGIKPGDKLLAINGQALGSGVTIGQTLESVEAGDTVTVLVERDGEEQSFDVATTASVSIMALEAEMAPHIAKMQVELEGLESLQALESLESLEGLEALQALETEFAELEHEFIILSEDVKGEAFEFRMGGLFALGSGSELVSNHAGLAPYFGTEDGVVVLRIDPDNPLGLMDGDVVLAIEGQDVSRPVDLGRAMMDAEPGAEIDLQIMRSKRMETLTGEVPASSFSHSWHEKP